MSNPDRLVKDMPDLTIEMQQNQKEYEPNDEN
jgi:hypothetical protein